MSSSSNRDAIQHVKWLNKRTIVFLGENPGETPEVYSLDVGTKRPKKLTNHPTPVVAFDISSDGQEILYEATPASRSVLKAPETRRTGVVISTQEIADLLAPNCAVGQERDAADRQLFVQRKGQGALRIYSTDFLTEYLPLSLSPTGRYGLLVAYVRDIPQAWAEYKDELLHRYITERRRPGQISGVSRYMLVDTIRRTLISLVDAPQWRNQGLAWARDGSSVFVSGTFLSLDSADSAERETRKNRTFVLEVKLPSREIAKVTDRNLRVLKWDEHTRKLILDEGYWWKDRSPEAYEKIGSAWKQVPVNEEDALASTRLSVTLEEDINTPPQIFISEPKGRRKSLLFDLNPAFAEFRFGKVEAVTWRATDGHLADGGLYLPPDYAPGRRYPLVIQTHGFRKDRFWMNGPWNSAFAAQPLAALGIVVLQVGNARYGEDMKFSNTPSEGPRQMATYEGAIDYLDSRGLVDRSHVGLVGFSRTAFYVAFTLTHSRYHFAAATLADGFDGGYINYMLWPNSDYVGVNGGLPVGSDLESWRLNSPGFNLDKVNVPVRLEDYGSVGVLAGWQWFSGLSLLQKPVDFIWLPYGGHLLVKPWERLASQQGNVDWFAFWLRGIEDPDPAKKDQYVRWKKMWQMINEDNKNSEPRP
jgi:dipeptidyl aminopeptidase/acylaminoacyl peptidase